MNTGPAMEVVELHRRIDEIAARGAHCSFDEPDVVAAEEHAGAGCSVCARALVNARDIGADLSFLEPPPSSPSSSERGQGDDPRERSSQRAGGARAAGGVSDPFAASRAAFSTPHSREPRILDPSAVVAHMHHTGPDEAARWHEIRELAAHVPTDGDPIERVLAQIERMLGFPLHFVSIIRGERVGYRVQRGLPFDARSLAGMRREVTFCTHCVCSGEPLVIKNAAAEPFFRGSPAVTRHRIRAYVGVPLRTSRDIVIGTLCVLDYRPRVVTPEAVRVLALFERRVSAEIERVRSDEPLSELVIDPPLGAVYKRAFFEELLAIELARTSSEGRTSSLTLLKVPPTLDLGALAALLRPEEIVGSLENGLLGILLSGAGEEEASARCAALSACGLEAAAAHTRARDVIPKTSAEWIDAARRSFTTS